jgi:Putative Ig domain
MLIAARGWASRALEFVTGKLDSRWHRSAVGCLALLLLGPSVSAQAQSGVDLTGSFGGTVQGPNGPCLMPGELRPGPGTFLPITFQNLGSQDANPVTYRLWLSRTNVLPFDASDSTNNVAFWPDGSVDLAGFGTLVQCLEVTVPSVSEGDYYVVLQMDPNDDYPADLNPADEIVFSPQTITIPAPSLVVSDIVPPTECFRGRPTDIGFSMTNDSPYDLNGFSVGLFLVPQDGRLSTTAYRVGQIDGVLLKAGCVITVLQGNVVFSNSDGCYQWPAVPAAETVPESVWDPRELPPGIYYAGVIADVTNLVLPRLGRDGNHIEASRPTVCDLPLPDFSITGREIAVAASISAGSGVPVERTIRNVGASSGTTTYAYFLNLNSDAADLEVHQGGVPIPVVLSSGQLTYTPTVTLDYPGDGGAYEDRSTDLLLIPSELAPPPGATYTLALVLDPGNQVRELDRANNRAGVGPIEISKSDLTIATVDLPPALAAVPYSFAFQAAGAFGEYSWSILAGAPPQMTLSRDGVLAGTPEQLGTWEFLLQVGSDRETQAASVIFRVVPPSGPLEIVRSGPELPPTAVGEPYLAQLAAEGGTPPYDWTTATNSLPSGLSLSLSGLLSGTPTSQALIPDGPGAVLITVTDQTGSSVSETYLLQVEEPGGLVITTTDIPPQRVGQAWSYDLRGMGCQGTDPNAPWCHWTLPSSQDLPEGLTLTTQGDGATSVGHLAGLSAQPGLWIFEVRVTDGAGHQGQCHLRLQVFDSLLPTSGQLLPNAVPGELYTAQLAAPAGSSVTWLLFSGELPPGLALGADGSITGRAHGKIGIRTYAFAAAAMNAEGDESLQPEAIRVIEPQGRSAGCSTGAGDLTASSAMSLVLLAFRSRRARVWENHPQ